MRTEKQSRMCLQFSMGQDYGAWVAEGSQTNRIEYSLAVMEELRLYAEEGFQNIPHGGMQVGALLLGDRNEDTGVVRVREWRPIECGHARGPSFTLSEADQKPLRQLLAECRLAAELEGLVPVGWFHTHTRSCIFLSPEDHGIHTQSFPEPWQVAWVMRPQKDLPSAVGFFSRTAGGEIPVEPSAAQFQIPPDASQSLKPRRPTAATPGGGSPRQPSAGPGPALISGRPPGLSRSSAEPISRQERPLFRPVGEPRIPTAPEEGSAQLLTMPAPAATAVMRPPAPPNEPFPRAAMWAALALLAVTAAGVSWHLCNLSRLSRVAGVRIEDADRSSLFISWDTAAPSILNADRAALRIVDGAVDRTLPLSAAAVRNGVVTHVRQGDDVEVRLTVFHQDKPSTQGVARFVGTAGSPLLHQEPSAPNLSTLAMPGQAQMQLQADVARLRGILRDESARADRLRDELVLLEHTATAGGLKLPGKRAVRR